MQASTPSYILGPSLSRKLLILDLNGTLVYRSRHKPPPDRSKRRLVDPYADTTLPRPLRPTYPRPYLKSFTEYLFHPHTKAWLDTMIWSSAQPHSVDDMVNRCFGERREELVAVWARDTLGLDEKDYHRKVQTTKDLARPWASLKHFPSSSTSSSSSVSESLQTHSAQTTLLLDDSPLKAKLQPWNHICIREYTAELRKADLEIWAGERQRGYEPAEITELPDHEADMPAENVNSSEMPSDSRKSKGQKQMKKMEARGLLEASIVNTYDQTLLAIVGILDHIRHESNVAGWVRGGGLTRITPTAKSRLLTQTSNEDVADTTTQWFHNASIHRYWVHHGLRALERLGIVACAGIRG
ncbi:hypothetical protein BYT27DRAFT_7117611 [Phlegmacium glaucopus]|nr:hypothetical protein BYT27DRAFT_7117611 [Phlegmacium glaucopus]